MREEDVPDLVLDFIMQAEADILEQENDGDFDPSVLERRIGTRITNITPSEVDEIEKMVHRDHYVGRLMRSVTGSVRRANKRMRGR